MNVKRTTKREELKADIPTETCLPRFLLFSCPQYYPAGGVEDLLNGFDRLEEAIAYCKGRGRSEDDEFQILDLVAGQWCSWNVHRRGEIKMHWEPVKKGFYA